MFAIRKANPSDARELSKMAEETFRATFSSANTAENMEIHCQRSYGEGIQAGEIANPSMLTLLCEADGRLAGFAQLRWGAVPKCVSAEAAGEIQRLYVPNPWHGKGVAQELMRACVVEVMRHGSTAVWLGVWENNPRAIAFYKKCGFVEVGAQVFHLGLDPQRDVVMVRPLRGE